MLETTTVVRSFKGSNSDRRFLSLSLSAVPSDGSFVQAESLDFLCELGGTCAKKEARGSPNKSGPGNGSFDRGGSIVACSRKDSWFLNHRFVLI